MFTSTSETQSWCFTERGVDAYFPVPACPARCQQGSNETLVLDVQPGIHAVFWSFAFS